VRVTGFVGGTPSLSFIGRCGIMSDLFGEKLSDEFVRKAIQEVLCGPGTNPPFVLLAPDEDAPGWRYTLYVEGGIPFDAADRLERALCRNPHYALCRNLGQLQEARVFVVEGRGYEQFANHLVEGGQRLGEIKPAVLSAKSGWSRILAGK